MKTKIALVFLILALTACAPAQPNMTGIQNTAIAIAQTGLALTQTALPTATPPLPTITPTPAIPFHTDLSCWQTKPLQAGNDIKGSLIFWYGNKNIFYWDVSSFRGKFFADGPNGWLNLPPDRNYVPYELAEHKIVLMFPNRPSVTLSLPPGERYYDLTYLPNGEILAAPGTDLMGRPTDNTNYKEGIGYTVAYNISDPKTGNLTSHSVLLPNFDFFTSGGVHRSYIAYSPDGKYILYRSALPGQKGKNGFSLLDLQSNQIKWTVLEDVNKEVGWEEGNYYMPVWKPDASSLTYIWTSNNESKDQNYYNVSLDGTITQFTRFEDVFPRGYILYSLPQWSLDLHYLAFQVEMPPDNPNHPREAELFIWDDVNKTLLNPCLPFSGFRTSRSYDWSFDSKHIALALSSFPTPSPVGTTTSFRNIILDIPNRVIYELPNDKDMRDYLKLSGDEIPYTVVFWVNWEIP